MHFITSLAVALLAGATSAAPSNLTTRVAFNPLSKRWDGDPNGNVYVIYSDTKMNWGSTDPIEAFAQADQECHDGQCSDFSADTAIYKKGDFPDDFQVNFKFDGTHERGLRDGLMELARTLISAAIEKRTKKWVFTPHCTGKLIGDCDGPTDKELTEHWCFERITIKYINPANEIQSDFAFDVDVVEKETDSGLCEDIMAGIGAVAGAVNGVAGGIFALASLLC